MYALFKDNKQISKAYKAKFEAANRAEEIGAIAEIPNGKLDLNWKIRYLAAGYEVREVGANSEKD